MKNTAANKSVNFEKATLLWSFTWDADWVSAVSFIGDKHFAAGNNLGEILIWELPEKPEPLGESPSEKANLLINQKGRFTSLPNQSDKWLGIPTSSIACYAQRTAG